MTGDRVTHLRPSPRGRGSGLAMGNGRPLRPQTHEVGRESCRRVILEKGMTAAGGGQPTLEDTGGAYSSQQWALATSLVG